MKIKRIYEINALPFLEELRVNKLDEIGDEVLNAIAFKWNFDAIYLMGVWERGNSTSGKTASKKQNFAASPFSIRKYKIAKNFGGKQALLKFKKKMNERGVKLLLDFVPNNTSRDCEWTEQHPDFYVKNEDSTIAFGAASPFEIWSDTAQLDYSNPKLRKMMLDELKKITSVCDGVRCDMSHLVLNSVFDENWKNAQTQGKCENQKEFWSEARKKAGNDFYLFAEAYGNSEYHLVELGFDAAYDKEKGFYDRLIAHLVNGKREELTSDIEGHLRGCNEAKVVTPNSEKIYGDFLVKFLENHDENRAAQVFGEELENALKIMLDQFGNPHGILLFQHGQLEGKRIKTPLFSKKFPREKVDREILKTYENLLETENWRNRIPKKFQTKKSEEKLAFWLR
ncbi:MAG: alpha-amylase family glycosyl hydrolase [Patescibacteria group bacterium]